MEPDSYIPNRLDDQWKLGFWDMDIAFPVLFGLFLGWLTDTKLGFMLMASIGIVISRRMARLKADHHGAFLLHWVYWHLPPSPLTWMRCTPPSSQRRMVG